MSKLPHAERAVVDLTKLRDYSLNPQHHVGKHKARVFLAALGVTLDDAEWLRQTVLDAARYAEAQPCYARTRQRRQGVWVRHQGHG